MYKMQLWRLNHSSKRIRIVSTLFLKRSLHTYGMRMLYNVRFA